MPARRPPWWWLKVFVLVAVIYVFLVTVLIGLALAVSWISTSFGWGNG